MLAAVDPAREHVGFMHVDGPAGTRGGFSLYVPEYYDSARSLRRWSWRCTAAAATAAPSCGAWVREARTRGFVVIAPTARGSTWSLMEPDVDGPNIDRMVDQVAVDWNIDPTRALLTGMSDGGTPHLLCPGCAASAVSRIWRRSPPSSIP